MLSRGFVLASLLVAGCVAAVEPELKVATSIEASAEPSARVSLTPLVDHHQHFLSPAAAELVNRTPLTLEQLPPPLQKLIQDRVDRFNDPARLKDLYRDDAVVLAIEPAGWTRGKDNIAAYLTRLFSRPFLITPFGYAEQGRLAHFSGYLSRKDGEITRHFGRIQLTLGKDPSGEWKIIAEAPTFPGPTVDPPLVAEDLVKLLDEANIRRAVVLSSAYYFDSPGELSSRRAYERVRAENDWTASQAALYPDRIIPFCSFNPLADHAIAELERCAATGSFNGIKLHFNTSGVDVRDPAHLAKVRQVFAKANSRGLPIMVHAQSGRDYGAEQAGIFVRDILTSAPDVPVVMAHLWGGGTYSPDALAVLASAVAGGQPGSQNLYFDLAQATMATGGSQAALQELAERIRQIGFSRVFYGSDGAVLGGLPPAAMWKQLREQMPLNEDEFGIIARNVAPYAR